MEKENKEKMDKNEIKELKMKEKQEKKEAKMKEKQENKTKNKQEKKLEKKPNKKIDKFTILSKVLAAFLAIFTIIGACFTFIYLIVNG